MHSLCGIVKWNREPIARCELGAMSEACWRPAEGRQYWVGDCAGLGSAVWHTTPESYLERQPFVGGDGRYVVVADARLDYRDELIASLKGGAGADSASTDIELILMAYLKWGETCGKYLFGDYVFAIWDTQEKRLFCVRDALGSKQLYYHVDGKWLLFASTISQLLANPAVDMQLDDLAIACYFTQRPARYLTEHTYYQNILRVPPAHATVFTADGKIRKVRYWDIDRERLLDYRDPGQYAEELRHLLTESVKWCSRSSTPLAATASGGMDSTSVAALLASQPGVKMKIYSITFGEGHAADESNYVRELAAHCGVEAEFIDGLAPSLCLDNLLDSYQYDESPPNFDDPVVHALLNQIARNGGRAATFGFGADALFLVQPYVFGDYLRSGRMVHGAQEYRAWRANYPGCRVPIYVLKRVVKTLIPPSWLKFWSCRKGGWSGWLSPEFAVKISRMAGWNGLPEPFDRQGFPSWHQSIRYWAITDGTYENHNMVRCLAMMHGIEVRDPFRDRRITEFMLALPPQQCLYRGRRKAVLRDAMSGILPDAITSRSDKTVFDSVATRAMQERHQRGEYKPASDWMSCRRGYVDIRRLRPMLKLRDFDAPTFLASRFNRVLYFESWLTKLFEFDIRGHAK